MMLSVVVFFASLAASGLAVGGVLRWLRRRQIFDIPNARSSHRLPTPRGGGLAVTPVLLLIFAALALWRAPLAGEPAVLAGALGLLLLSWRDDRVGLPPSLRLLCQFLAVAIGLMGMPPDFLLFQGILPFTADRALAALAWLWFLNLYNFMDGIDGITGSETISLAGGLALLGGMVEESLALIGVSLGFLAWNWHPAKIFLGDSGSIPLGYLLGWLLLLAAGQGHWAAALILPAYYLADASLTLLKRLLRGEKIWQAHREHFYQRAVQNGLRHDQVSMAILAGNGVLIGLALWSVAAPWPALAAATLVTAALLTALSLSKGRERP